MLMIVILQIRSYQVAGVIACEPDLNDEDEEGAQAAEMEGFQGVPLQRSVPVCRDKHIITNPVYNLVLADKARLIAASGLDVHLGPLQSLHPQLSTPFTQTDQAVPAWAASNINNGRSEGSTNASKHTKGQLQPVQLPLYVKRTYDQAVAADRRHLLEFRRDQGLDANSQRRSMSVQQRQQKVLASLLEPPVPGPRLGTTAIVAAGMLQAVNKSSSGSADAGASMHAISAAATAASTGAPKAATAASDGGVIMHSEVQWGKGKNRKKPQL